MRLQFLVFATAAHAKLGRLARVVGRETTLKSSYDFIIVGGGTAGLTIADRLTEDPSVSVLVIESGPFDQQEDQVLIPGFTNSSKSLPYYFPDIFSLPEPGLDYRTFNVTTSCVVGGASSTNGMVYDRGSAADYDAWEQLGNPGWGWDGLFPYFKKSETFTPPDPAFAAEWGISWDVSANGVGGPIQSSYPPYMFPSAIGFLQGLAELGFPKGKDPGAGTKNGVYWIPASVHPDNQTRSYARDAHYDRIIAGRPNYHLLPMHSVVKVLTEGQRAVGVEYIYRETGETACVKTSKEVVVSAGTIESPQILQRSGIGPKYILDKLGIKTVVDLPGVGYNLQDHAYTAIMSNYSDPLRPLYTDRWANNTLAAADLAEYFATRTGPYTVGGGNTVAFLPTSLLIPTLNTTATNITASSILALARTTVAHDIYPFPDTPPAVLAGWAAQHAIILRLYASSDAATVEFAFNASPFMVAYLSRPLSRGSVLATSSKIINTSLGFFPAPPPTVRYGTMLARSDTSILVAATRRLREIMRTPAAREAFGARTVEAVPLPGTGGRDSDDVLAAAMHAQCEPADNHPVGTCAMMPRELGGVVGSALEVYGVEGLSVVDASVMPLIPAAHPASTVYAVTEKAADIIKKRHGITIGVLDGY